MKLLRGNRLRKTTDRLLKLRKKESIWQNRGGMLYVVARFLIFFQNFSEVVEWHFYRDIEEPALELSDVVLSGEVMLQRHIKALG